MQAVPVMGTASFVGTEADGGCVTLTGKKRVAIVGFCQTNRDRTPYHDPEFEIWGLNRGGIFMARADRWWDMHSPTIRGWNHRRPGDHMEWLAKFPGPVYLHEADPAIPNSITFPLAEIAADLGENIYRLDAAWNLTDSKDRPYCDSSIAYEIALAIHEGFEEIWVVGVDLSTESEYVWQRSGVSFLLGVAAGRGIKVVLPDNCPLLTGNLYGRGFLTEQGEHLSVTQMESRLTGLEHERNHLATQLHELHGARAELQYNLTHLVPGIDHLMIAAEARRLGQAVDLTERQLREAYGALKETLLLRRRTLEANLGRVQADLDEVRGAQKVTAELLKTIAPGLDHEKMEERRKRIEQTLVGTQAQVETVQGALKENVYWIHQTPDGMDPQQAIAQLLDRAIPSDGELSEGDLSALGQINQPYPGQKELVGAA